MDDSIKMSARGYGKAKARLKYLQLEKRKEIVKRIAIARGFGDLSENAEYDAAKLEQASNEAEIIELDAKIKRADIMEESITHAEHEKYTKRLDELKNVIKTDLVKKIEDMHQADDTEDTEEYKEAKTALMEVESEICELETLLEYAKIGESDEDTGRIHIGSKVRIYDCDLEEEVVYTIAGSLEADPRNDIISNESPVGVALMNKKQGEEVSVNSPSGIYKIKILSIE